MFYLVIFLFRVSMVIILALYLSFGQDTHQVSGCALGVLSNNQLEFWKRGSLSCYHFWQPNSLFFFNGHPMCLSLCLGCLALQLICYKSKSSRFISLLIHYQSAILKRRITKIHGNTYSVIRWNWRKFDFYLDNTIFSKNSIQIILCGLQTQIEYCYHIRCFSSLKFL